MDRNPILSARRLQRANYRPAIPRHGGLLMPTPEIKASVSPLRAWRGVSCQGTRSLAKGRVSEVRTHEVRVGS